MQGVHEHESFFAICNHMPGADRALRVGGTVVFRTGGWSAKLREHERKEPTGINPFILYLDLVIDPPAEGMAVPEVLTPVELDEFRVEDPALEYQEVHFIVVGTEDEPPERVEVEHPE